ncbi:hypothetical protein DN745_00890 [Bradymonas sediminis]|uniref:Uncharacterized protein n=1 Tax=Bradymonas sediminis TaxID=1548548 RepID=A0A2Z4FGF2_9DELT|nr:hypothetical protein DN745_00890 [Bradymonas sediminis]
MPEKNFVLSGHVAHLAHAEIEAQGEGDADQLTGVLVDPGPPIQGLLDIELDIIQALADLLAGGVNRLAQLGGMGVEVSLRRGAPN